MSSKEFAVWQAMDKRGELRSDRELFGTLIAAVCNFGFRHPENMIGVEHIFPLPVDPEKQKQEQKEKQIKAFDTLTKRQDYSEFIWKT